MKSHSDGVVATVERDELRLEHNVTIDLQAGCNGLETTEARSTSGIDRGEVDIITPDSSHVHSTNIDLEIRQLCVAREGNTSDSLVVDCSSDLAVVGIDNSGVGQHEGGSGVSDGLATRNCHSRSRTDLELGGGELPEAVGGVDRSPGEGAVELSGVDVSELVGADGGLSKIGGEDWHGEAGLCVVEEGLLLDWFDGVELGESETDESVGLGILDEGRGDGGCELNGLTGHSCSTNVNSVSANIASCSRSITVRDGERGTLNELE